jgi:hypothetical protein
MESPSEKTVVEKFRELENVGLTARFFGLSFREAYEILDLADALPSGPRRHINVTAAKTATPAFRESIRERDFQRCRLCGRTQKTRKLHTHHVNFNEYDNYPQNLITLCERCHRTAHGFGKDVLMAGFQAILSK